MDDFAMAITLSPHSAHVYFNRANLFASINMLTEADQDYTTGVYRLDQIKLVSNKFFDHLKKF